MVLVANKADLESDRVVSDTIRLWQAAAYGLYNEGDSLCTQTLHCLLVGADIGS